MRLDKRFAISALALIVLVAAAFYVLAGEQRRDRETELEELDRLSDVLGKVLDFYVDEKEMNDLVDDAIKGILEDLDPHSVYLDKHQYDNLMIDTKGEFGGLGITITVREGFPTVISPIEDTAGYRAARSRIVSSRCSPSLMPGVSTTCVCISIPRSARRSIWDRTSGISFRPRSRCRSAGSVAWTET